MLQHSQRSSGQKTPTDINELTEEYLRLAYHGICAKGEDFNTLLKTDFNARVPSLYIIPQDIGKVLLNICNKAFYAVNEKKKAGDENYQATVSVQTKRAGNNIEIKVSDN